MRPIAAIIVVVFGVCGITTAARAQSSTCKQCRAQQEACTNNYSAKTCKTDYDICMKSCQKKSQLDKPIPSKGRAAGSCNGELAGDRVGAGRALASAPLLLRPEPGRRSGADEGEICLDRRPAAAGQLSEYEPGVGGL